MPFDINDKCIPDIEKTITRFDVNYIRMTFISQTKNDIRYIGRLYRKSRMAFDVNDVYIASTSSVSAASTGNYLNSRATKY